MTMRPDIPRVITEMLLSVQKSINNALSDILLTRDGCTAVRELEEASAELSEATHHLRNHINSSMSTGSEQRTEEP